MEAPQIPELRFIDLPGHPDCPIGYTLKPLKGPSLINTTDTHSTAQVSKSIIWLIFINGLGLPQAFWQPTIQLLEADLTSNPSSHNPVPSHADVDTNVEIYATTYDRYGQGVSRPPQRDASSNNWTPTPHDCLDAANELAELIHQLHPAVLSSSSHNTSSSPPPPPTTNQSTSKSTSKTAIKIILISHSLGVPITRLFAERHDAPNLELDLAGLLLIDSNIANINMVDLLPDPDGLAPITLPADTMPEQLRQTRANYAKLFAPAAPNAENLDRVSLLELLPRADGPVLARRRRRRHEGAGDVQTVSVNGNGNAEGKGLALALALTVIAHDSEVFAEEGLRIATRGLTMEFIEPAWREYNAGLLRLDGSVEGEEEDEGKKIVVATGAGHFVQRDNPRCVADEIWKMVERL